MSPAEAMIEEVDGIIAGADKRRRMAILRQITNLFVDNARWLDESVIATFDEVMLRLARDVDFRVRYAVSERLADIPKAPRKMVRELLSTTITRSRRRFSGAPSASATMI